MIARQTLFKSKSVELIRRNSLSRLAVGLLSKDSQGPQLLFEAFLLWGSKEVGILVTKGVMRVVLRFD